ncbi:hypothetical protein SM871_002683 [Yersinia enterocolitica]
MNNNKRPITASLSRSEFIQPSAAVNEAAAIADFCDKQVLLRQYCSCPYSPIFIIYANTLNK